MLKDLATFFVIGTQVLILGAQLIAKCDDNEKRWTYKSSLKTGFATQLMYFLAILISLGILM